MEINEIHKLLDILPDVVKSAILEADADPETPEASILNIMEIVMDLGQPPLVRYQDDTNKFSRFAVEFNNTPLISEADLQYILKKCGNELKHDNRTGINGTLHRISALVDRHNVPSGLTLRVGRNIENSEWAIADLIEDGQNVLVVAPPSFGKTSCLRGVARLASTELGRRTIIVDDSDEIAGFGRIPHPCVGKARKISVPIGFSQSDILLQAVANHSPEVLLADEIGSSEDVQAILSVANRGVQIIATVHGTDLDTVIKNPVLCDLLGGIKSVTLTDAEAMRRNTKKSVQERQAPAPFSAMVVIKNFSNVEVYHNLGIVLDSILAEKQVFPEVRVRNGSTFDTEVEQKIDEGNAKKWKDALPTVNKEYETVTKHYKDSRTKSRRVKSKR